MSEWGTSRKTMSLENSPTKSIHRNNRARMAPPPPPAHLSEFLSYVNGTANNKDKTNGTKEEEDVVDELGLNKVEKELKKKLKLKRKSNLSTATSNLTSSNSSMNWSISSEMTASTMDLDVILSKKDINDSLSQFKELEYVTNELSEGLKSVSDLFGKFAHVLEDISRSKGSGKYGESLGAFSNYQYLISNQHRYLSEALKTQFGDQLNSIKTKFSKKHTEREEVFEKEYKNLVKELKVLEKLENRLRRSKTRNLIVYKTNLNELSNKLNEIDHMHHDYYVDSLDLLEHTHGNILSHAKTIVQHESLVFDKLSEKTKPGNGIDDLIAEEASISGEDETFIDETINGDDDTDQSKTANSHEYKNIDDLVSETLKNENKTYQRDDIAHAPLFEVLLPCTSSIKEQLEGSLNHILDDTYNNSNNSEEVNDV